MNAADTLSGNLQALERAIGRPVAMPGDDPGVSIEAGPPMTAFIRDEDGQSILFHSRRNPMAEADRALDTATGGEPPSSVVVVGAGLGYVPEAIERRYPDARVVVIEPEPAFARHMLARRDWRRAIAEGKLLVLPGPDYPGAAQAWKLVGEQASTVTIEHPVLSRVRPDRVAEGRAVLSRIRFDAQANAEARRALEGPYLRNTLANLGVLAREGDAADLDGAFPNVPAIVVAAGPSLDRQVDDIRAAANRAVIVSVDTAVRPLLLAGITPHLVVAVDPSEANAAHLDGLPPDLEMWLVGEASLDPRAFRAFWNRTFAFRVASHEPWPWLRQAGLDAGTLRAWGSVLTTAFDLALRMGCGPIALAGADLAYSGHRPYCRGTIYERDWAVAAARGEALPALWKRLLAERATTTMLGAKQKPVLTAPRLVAFRDWLVDAAIASGGRVVVLPGDGILQDGPLDVVPLTQLIVHDAPRVDRCSLARRWRRTGARAERLASARRVVADARAGQPPAALRRWQSIAEASGLSMTEALDAAEASLGDASPMPEWRIETGDRSMPERLAAFREFLATPAPAGVPSIAAADGHQGCDDGLACAAMAIGELQVVVPRRIAPLARHPRVLQPLAAAAFENDTVSGRVLDVEARLGAVLDRCRAARPCDTLLDAAIGTWADASAHRNDQVPGGLLVAAAIAEWGLVSAGSSVGPLATREMAGPGSLWTGRDEAARALAEMLRAFTRQLEGHAVADDDVVAVRASIERGGETLAAATVAVAAQDLSRACTGLVRKQGGRASSASLAMSRGDVTCRFALAPERLTPRVSRVLAGARSVRPRSLDGVLPRCQFATSLDEGEALVGGVLRHDNFAINEDGSVRRLSDWPRPMIGVAPWGDRGGLVAWNNAEADPVIMLRRTTTAATELHSVPFRPSFPVVDADGGTWWASYFGGLWSWHPDRGARREADVPPALGIRRVGDCLRLDGVEKSAGGVTRTRDGRAWTWRPGEDVAPVAVGPDGPTWSTSGVAGWTAESFPHADIVRITAPGESVFELTCHYPVSVAWAGASLVVTSTTGGLVLFFPRLRHVLHSLP